MWINEIKFDIKTKLLYKLSRDGETIEKFHELCDNIKDNLIIIKAENNTIFGGYCICCLIYIETIFFSFNFIFV